MTGTDQSYPCKLRLPHHNLSSIKEGLQPTLVLERTWARPYQKKVFSCDPSNRTAVRAVRSTNFKVIFEHIRIPLYDAPQAPCNRQTHLSGSPLDLATVRPFFLNRLPNTLALLAYIDYFYMKLTPSSPPPPSSGKHTRLCQLVPRRSAQPSGTLFRSNLEASSTIRRAFAFISRDSTPRCIWFHKNWLWVPTRRTSEALR